MKMVNKFKTMEIYDEPNGTQLLFDGEPWLYYDFDRHSKEEIAANIQRWIDTEKPQSVLDRRNQVIPQFGIPNTRGLDTWRSGSDYPMDGGENVTN